MTRLRSTLLCLLLAFSAGCLDVTTVVNVNKDGSGFVSETTYVSSSFESMMKDTLVQLGMEDAPALQINEEAFRKRAIEMGSDVMFRKAEEISKDGRAGIRVIYTFDDINYLRIKTEPQPPLPPGATATKEGTEETPITFRFEEGDIATLTVLLPQANSDDTWDPMTSASVASPDDAELEQIRQIFEGFRVRLILRVDGEITDTDASFVHLNKKTNKRNLVTLLNMDVGALLSDEERFRELATAGPVQDLRAAKQLLEGFPGISIEDQEEIHISFK